jgi:hypothetical protein
MPKLKHGQFIKMFTPQGYEVLDHLHLTLEREEKNYWFVVAHCVVQMKNISSELSSVPKPYPEALSDGIRAAKHYNIPLIKSLRGIKYKIVWAPEQPDTPSQRRSKRDLMAERFSSAKRRRK